MNADAQPEVFQGRGGFVKSRHFDKHFIKNQNQGLFLKNHGIYHSPHLVAHMK